MAPNPDLTRQRLITAAETLFAERGIEAVSLREINAAAGQRNATALQYHFIDRNGLLGAVLRKHHHDVEIRRHALLDAYESEDGDDLRTLAAALVRPSAAKLADPDGGRAYLRIHAELLNRPELPPALRSPTNTGDSVYRWRTLVGPLLSDVAVKRLHHRFTAIRVCAVELARRAASPPRRDDRLFTSHVVDLVTALLAAPISTETQRLLDDPGRQRSSRTSS